MDNPIVIIVALLLFIALAIAAPVHGWRFGCKVAREEIEREEREAREA